MREQFPVTQSMWSARGVANSRSGSQLPAHFGWIGERFGRRVRLPYGPGRNNQVPAVLGMAIRSVLELAALGELLERVDPGCLEQSITRVAAINLHRYERFCNQIDEIIGQLRSDAGLPCDSPRRLEPKRAAKHCEPAQDRPLGMR